MIVGLSQAIGTCGGLAANPSLALDDSFFSFFFFLPLSLYSLQA